MAKKILRSFVLKAAAFLLCLLMAWTGFYQIIDRLDGMMNYDREIAYHGMLYRFEQSFQQSQFLNNQLASTLNTMDWLLHDESDQVLTANGVNRGRLSSSLVNFIGSVSFRFGDIRYDGGAIKTNDAYYIELTPGGREYNIKGGDYFSYWMDGSIPPEVDDDYDDVYVDEYTDEDGIETAPATGDNTKAPVVYRPTDYILVSINYEQAKPYQLQWAEERDVLMGAIRDSLLCMLVILAAVIYLLCVAGKKPADDDIHMMLIDRMPVEVNLMLILSALGGIVFLIALELNLISGAGARELLMPLAAGNTLCSGLIVILLMSLVRNIRNRSCMSHSFLLRACRWCWRMFKRSAGWCWGILKKLASRVWGTRNKLWGNMKTTGKRSWNGIGDYCRAVQDRLFKHYRTRKVLLLFFGYTVVLAFLAAVFGKGYYYDDEGFVWLILGLVWFWVSASFVLKRINGFEQIVEGIQHLRAGELDYKLSNLPTGVFANMAEDINSLGDGMQAALQTEIRAERMKSELITNVSHDLKTPLTSILNYADLLCQEQLTPEEANDYAKIIYQKSIRLKNLTSDLFDISKVQSGAEQVACERLDACTLARQALAEQDCAIQASGLMMKISIPDGEVPIWADGKKMSRVMENLLSNCLKYAMKGTRVYLTVAVQKNNTALIEFKNISNYEMNFAVDEITERFVRGDASRSTEGSGLGLAIAKSYVEACGGIMTVETDGDLFKVRISFPLLGSRPTL